jgi:hypothetical protein
MDDRYFYRKNMITTVVMLFLAVIQLIINIGISYYWTPLQGKISGIEGFAEAGSSANVFGYLVVFLLLFFPPAAVALLSREAGEKTQYRFILAIPALTYLISGILLIKQLAPLAHVFEDIYSIVDNFVYVPMLAQLFITFAYLALVVIKPDLFATKVVGIITVFVSIIYFIADAGFFAYLHLMEVLDGEFGLVQFGLFIGAFILDVVTFFLFMSVHMTYCAMQREPLIEERYEKIQEKRAARRASKKAEESEEEYLEDGEDEPFLEDDIEVEPIEDGDTIKIAVIAEAEAEEAYEEAADGEETDEAADAEPVSDAEVEPEEAYEEVADGEVADEAAEPEAAEQTDEPAEAADGEAADEPAEKDADA